MSTFNNFVQCRITTPITAAANSIGLYAAVPPYSLPSEEGGLLVLTDSPTKPSKLEVISYTSRSALGLYGVTRGLEGTTALTWTGPAYCYQSILAGELNGLYARLSDIGDISQLPIEDANNLVDTVIEIVGGLNEIVRYIDENFSPTDDDAGLGDTNATWSADKSSRELEDKADKTTQVIAGTGLAGGGTLASNLTLNVSYGTTAETSVQGNDSRVVNALQKANILQTTGTSSSDLMSQKATTDSMYNIPSVPKSSAYTVTAANKGASIDTTANVTIPASVFAVGDVIVVTNTSATDSSITAASGVTIRLAGSDSTGVRTLAGYGVATLRMVSSNVWFASGAGLS